MDYDIVIIGAGIHGCAVAQAAAASGYRTLLLEQAAQAASATSSRSSKLIHGGLRYLESVQFRLVRECLRERALLLANAPHLVQLQPFHIPIYRTTRRRPWQIRLGLSLYALLGGKGFRRVAASQWDNLDSISTRELQAVYRYHDAQTDDRQLTRAVLASALTLGARVEFNSTVSQANCSGSRCTIQYRSAGGKQQVSASTLVNATGPWVNRTLELVTPAPSQLSIDLVQGTHLLLPGKLRQGMYYLEAPQDQRAVFAMPWENHTLLGTTETLFRGEPESVVPLQAEIDYLLEVYNHYFETDLGPADVLEAFAGVRVLPRSDKNSFYRSRDTRLHVDAPACPRLISIYGGKLTSQRITAERVMQQLGPLLPQRTAKVDTRTLQLPAI